MHNIFITGASSKIGCTLVKNISDKAWQVVVLIRDPFKAFDVSGVKVVQGDLLDPESYTAGLEGIDTVLHMAAVTHTNNADMYYAVNTDATLKLIEASQAKGVKRFIYISTRAISAEGGHYAKSKLAAEEHVKNSSLDWVIVRLAEVYGSSGKEGVDMIMDNIHKFPFVPVIGDGKYKVAPIHVSDAVSSIISVIEKADIKSRIYNIAGPESFTYNQFIDRVLEIKHLKKMKVHIPVAVFRFLAGFSVILFKDRFIAMDQLARLFSEKEEDISIAEKELSFAPSSLEDIIGRRGENEA